MSTRNIAFNGINLQDSNIITSQIDHELSSRKVTVLETGKVGAKVTNQRISSKPIPVSGKIIDATQDLLDARLLTLFKALPGQSGNLDVDYNGAVLRYPAVCTGFLIRRTPGDISRVQYNADFIALAPGRLTTLTTQLWAAQIANLAQVYNFLGFIEPNPKLTLTINTQTAMTSAEIKNVTTAQSLIITRAFVNGDVIVVDRDSLSVTVNGVRVDYVGVIPDADLGNNSLQVNITATAKNFDFKIEYNQQFL